MAAPTLPDVKLSAGSGFGEVEVRLAETQFGDGYVLAGALGINNQVRTYEASWETVPAADAERVRAFLAARGGHEPFMFQPPGEAAPIKWRCKSWSGPKWVGPLHRTLRATFVEDFSP